MGYPMPSIIVTPLSRLTDVIQTSGAQDVLTLMMPGKDTPDSTALGVPRHGVVAFSDILEPREGYMLPDIEHVSALLDFVREWRQQTPLIIHCFAGVSRSPAAAYIAACALMPERHEALLAHALRLLSPSATPNARLVAVADAMLGREGRMTNAIRALGRGKDAFEGEVFSIEIAEEKANA